MYKISVGSDPEHERLIAEVEFNGELCFIMNEERGIGKYSIEIYPPNKHECLDLELNDFINAVDLARSRLKALGGEVM